MRTLINAGLAAAVLAMSPLGYAGNDAAKSNQSFQLAQAASSCKDKCEQSKEQCFAQYTATDVRGNKYITPDGHKICWSSYHECVKYCPKK